MDTLSPVVICSDARRIPLADGSVHCVVTSPPYWGLRAYGGDPGMIGLEPTFEEHLENLVEVFREVWRVLRDDGTLWLNYGDAYFGGKGASNNTSKQLAGRTSETLNAGQHYVNKHGGMRPLDRPQANFKPKDLLMMPARVAMALQADGWWLRSEIVWHKPNPMPESVTDRPTSSHEKVFLLTKRPRYFYDADAVREAYAPRRASKDGKLINDMASGMSGQREKAFKPRPEKHPGGANLRNVWKVPTHSFTGGFETTDLIQLSTSQAQEHVAKDSGSDDDILRTTSPNCPVHADQIDSVPTGFYDGLTTAHKKRIRDNDGRHDPEPRDDSFSIQHIPGRCQVHPSTKDCSDPLGSPSAISHNKKNHKTDHDRAFSEHAKSCEGKKDHTEHKQPQQQERALTCRDTAENNNEDDNRVSSCEPKSHSRSVHTSALGNSSEPYKPPCVCRYYRKVTKKSSHFATFPPALAKRCILAGTSAAGVCEGCGAPWVRQVERTLALDGKNPDPERYIENDSNDQGSNRYKDGHVSGSYEVKTTGWLPSCTCDAGRVPATVFDPFGGSGTVGICAEELGRRSALLDINPEYCQMARERIDAQQPSLPLLG